MNPYLPLETDLALESSRTRRKVCLGSLMCGTAYVLTIVLAFVPAVNVKVYGPMEAFRILWFILTVAQFVGFLFVGIRIQKRRFNKCRPLRALFLAIPITVTLNVLFWCHAQVGEMLVPVHLKTELSRCIGDAIACMVVYTIITTATVRYWHSIRSARQFLSVLICVFLGSASFISIPVVYHHLRTTNSSLNDTALVYAVELILVLLLNQVSLYLALVAFEPEQNPVSQPSRESGFSPTT